MSGELLHRTEEKIPLRWLGSGQAWRRAVLSERSVHEGNHNCSPVKRVEYMKFKVHHVTHGHCWLVNGQGGEKF